MTDSLGLGDTATPSRATPMALDPGTLVSRYRILHRLGQGGMGVVYVAEDTTLQREVALKVLGGDAAIDPELRRRFEREAQAMARLSHRNVVGVHDFGFHQDHPFIVMELLRGESLRQWLDRKPRPWAELIPVLLDAARGLEAAHRAGLVHRDFKPENVLVAEDGRVAVADFGISRDVGQPEAQPPAAPLDLNDTAPALTRPGALLGTPKYMAPEQFTGGPVTALSDQYAFGLVLYEAVYGQSPFADTRANLAQLISARLANAPVRPPTAEARGPAALWPLLQRALATGPNDRWPSLGELISELERLAKPVAARRPPWVRRLAAAAVVVALAAFGVGVLLPHGLGAFTVSAPPSASRLPEATRKLETALGLWREGSAGPALRLIQEALRLDPDYAAAHLWGALVDSDAARARALYAGAASHKEKLSPFEQLLFEALGPGEVPMVNRDAWMATVDVLQSQRPRVGVLRYLAARLRIDAHQLDAAGESLSEAVRLDPGLDAPAQLLRALIGKRKAQVPEALAALDTCLQRHPRSTACTAGRAQIEGYAGQCGAMERDARAWAGLDPQDPEAFNALANALYAQGSPWAGVDEALKAQAAVMPKENEAGPRTLWLEGVTALAAQGDLDAARVRAKALVDAIPPGATLYTHLDVSFGLLLVMAEMGDDAGVVALAKDIVDRALAWTPDQPQQFGLVMVYAQALFNRGALDQAGLEQARLKWIALARSAEHARTPIRIWASAYASGIRTEEAALEALRVRPQFGEEELGPAALQPSGALVVGNVYALAHQPQKALPFLEVATETCYRLENPFVWAQAMLALGSVREQLGEPDLAKAAYQRLVAALGDTKPRSVSADKARARLAALNAN